MSPYSYLLTRVTFLFKPSKKSNNGTDVNAGQIPQILYRVIAPDAPPSRPHANLEAVHSISKNFCKVVTPVIWEIFLFDDSFNFTDNLRLIPGLLHGFAKSDPMGLVCFENVDSNRIYWASHRT